MDDAAVIKLSDDLAIVQTADFITPMVDDPYQFGRIAAANSISDVYAMGGRPISALNLVCWPEHLPGEFLRELLHGGEEVAREAGCPVVGGHTIADREPKYGMAVNGTIHPDKILRNIGALPGDILFLTKPLGTGILSVALQLGQASPEEIAVLTDTMASLNKGASEAALAAGARAMTDVTGFGLAGHLLEMIGDGKDLGVEVSVRRLPLLSGIFRHIADAVLPEGVERNRAMVKERLKVDEDVVDAYEILVCDPQTSGGLAVAVPPDKEETFAEEASRRNCDASRIGTFTDTGYTRLKN